MNVTTLVVVGTLAAHAPAGQQAPEAPPQAPAAAARPSPDTRRQDIRIMEMALTNALQSGARELARQLKLSEPSSAFVTAAGRARGFVLDGYGMFFDVDVPGMKQSVVWSATMVQLAQDRERAIQAANEMRPDDPLRPLAFRRVRQLEQLMAQAQAGGVLVQPAAPALPPNAPMQLERDRIKAADVPGPLAESVAVTSASPAVQTQSNLVASIQQPMPEIRDPNELYTEAVKNALIDAMLRYSQFLKVGESEWLTVAASDSDGPQTPGQLDETTRILISVRGTDLLAFHSNKLTREEVLKKVQVKEF